MKCLVPLMTKSPPCCTALVFIPRRSEPACGSLMARHSTRSPRTLKPLRCTAGKRIASLAIAALAATGLALISSNDFINRFGGFLALVLFLFTPWTAINLVDFYIVRKGHYSIREIFNPNGIYGRWNWRGLLAYGTGFLVMIPFFSTATYQGPVARALGGADIAMLVGLPVAAAVSLLACRSLNIEQDRRHARSADMGLDP